MPASNPPIFAPFAAAKVKSMRELAIRHPPRVRTLLFVTVLVMTAVPLTGAFYLLRHVLQTSLDLGFNSQIVAVLDDGLQNLRTLGRLDEAGRDRYRQQFEDVEQLRHVYANPALLKGTILQSLQLYFGIGFLGAIFLSVLVAALLSRRIAAIHGLALDELTRQRAKVRYLEEISSWQELARILAHEIKNPLTPIQVLITSLTKSYAMKTPQEFERQLRQTEAMIGEELSHLLQTVSKFSDFSRLPAAQLREANLAEVLERQTAALASAFPAAQIDVRIDARAAGARVRLDASMFRQVLTNLIRNALEANPGRSVRFGIAVDAADSGLRIDIGNDGAPVPAALASRIFDPYVSGTGGKENIGLGLAIVKKIIFEHGGDIDYLEAQGKPVFSITLPRMA
jgi:signal transduction histidine kinase